MPTSFASLAAGQQATVTVKVSASASEALRLVQGTVRLLVGKSTVAKPLAVSLTLVAPELINGIAVPPEPPPELNNPTLAGFDVNGNGVRDDIDRTIATRYGTSPKAFRGALISARAHQQVLTLGITSEANARSSLTSSSRAGICAGGDFESVGFKASQELNRIFLQTYNTPERLSAKSRISAIADVFAVSVTDVVCN